MFHRRLFQCPEVDRPKVFGEGNVQGGIFGPCGTDNRHRERPWGNSSGKRRYGERGGKVLAVK